MDDNSHIVEITVLYKTPDNHAMDELKDLNIPDLKTTTELTMYIDIGLVTMFCISGAFSSCTEMHTTKGLFIVKMDITAFKYMYEETLGVKVKSYTNEEIT